MKFWEVAKELTEHPEKRFKRGEGLFVDFLSNEEGFLTYKSFFKKELIHGGGMEGNIGLEDSDEWFPVMSFTPPNRGTSVQPAPSQFDPFIINTKSAEQPDVKFFVNHEQMAHEAAMQHVRSHLWKAAELADEYCDVYFRILKRFEE